MDPYCFPEIWRLTPVWLDLSSPFFRVSRNALSLGRKNNHLCRLGKAKRAQREPVFCWARFALPNLPVLIIFLFFGSRPDQAIANQATALLRGNTAAGSAALEPASFYLPPFPKGDRGGFNGADDSPNHCYRFHRRGFHPSKPPFTKGGFYLPSFSGGVAKTTTCVG